MPSKHANGLQLHLNETKHLIWLLPNVAATFVAEYSTRPLMDDGSSSSNLFWSRTGSSESPMVRIEKPWCNELNVCLLIGRTWVRFQQNPNVSSPFGHTVVGKKPSSVFHVEWMCSLPCHKKANALWVWTRYHITYLSAATLLSSKEHESSQIFFLTLGHSYQNWRWHLLRAWRRH